MNIKTCVYGIICFILSGVLCTHEVQTEEIEANMFKDKIFELLEKIPQSSGNLHIGPIRLHPSIKISETYDDNVLNSSSKPVHDFYTTYEPNISLLLPIRGHLLTFNSGYMIKEYEGFSTRVPEQDRVNRTFGGSIGLNFANGFNINLSERVAFIITPGRVTRRTNQRVQFPGDDPTDEPEDPDDIEDLFGINTFTPKRTVTNNVASISIDLPDFFDKLDFSLNWSNIDSSYKQRGAKGADRNKDNFRIGVTFDPLRTINISASFDYSYIRYDKRFINDSVYRTIPFKLTWKPTYKSTFFFAGSLNHRDYGNRSLYKNYSGYNSTLGYRFNVTEKDNLTVKIERSLREQQFQTRRLSSGGSIEDTNPFYFSQIDMDWVHKFSNRFSILISPTFQHLRFREKQLFTSKSGTDVIKHRKVDVIKLEIKGRYAAPQGWLFSEISYKYSNRNSNVGGGGNIKSVAMITVGLNF